MSELRKKYKAIFWDWNGTLLDDLSFCIGCINQMIEARSLNPLDREGYRHVFGFPVKAYYEKVGFDFEKEPWDKVAMEFMHLYWDGMKSCSVFPDAKRTLSGVRAAGLKQYVLSAMEQDSLRDLVDFYKLTNYFEKITGIQDHFANGKSKMARELLDASGLRPEEVLMVGDTYHDFEVAAQNGIDCIFVSRGHQSTQRLFKANVPVLVALEDVLAYINV